MTDLVSMTHKLPCSGEIVAAPKEHSRANQQTKKKTQRCTFQFQRTIPFSPGRCACPSCKEKKNRERNREETGWIRTYNLFDKEICSTGTALMIVGSRNRARKEEQEETHNRSSDLQDAAMNGLHYMIASRVSELRAAGTWRSGDDALSIGDAAIAAAAARRW